MNLNLKSRPAFFLLVLLMLAIVCTTPFAVYQLTWSSNGCIWPHGTIFEYIHGRALKFEECTELLDYLNEPSGDCSMRISYYILRHATEPQVRDRLELYARECDSDPALRAAMILLESGDDPEARWRCLLSAADNVRLSFTVSELLLGMLKGDEPIDATEIIDLVVISSTDRAKRFWMRLLARFAKQDKVIPFLLSESYSANLYVRDAAVEALGETRGLDANGDTVSQVIKRLKEIGSTEALHSIGHYTQRKEVVDLLLSEYKFGKSRDGRLTAVYYLVRSQPWRVVFPIVCASVTSSDADYRLVAWNGLKDRSDLLASLDRYWAVWIWGIEMVIGVIVGIFAFRRRRQGRGVCHRLVFEPNDDSFRRTRRGT